MTDEPISFDEERRRRAATRGGKDAIRAAISGAQEAEPIAVNGGAPGAAITPTPGGRLEMRGDGLYFKSGEDKRAYRIAGYFEVMSETRDDDAQTWGLLLRFLDRDGIMQQVVATRDMFAGEGTELRNLLARRGLFVHPSPASRAALNEYLALIATPQRARVVTRTGWHRIEGCRVFVLPGEVFGAAPIDVIYLPGTSEASLYNVSGSLEDWQERVSRLCMGNSRLILAVSAAFAAPLLDLVGEEGGGLHFRGGSRIGKTTALRVGASVWGGDAAGGAAAYVRQWRATSNATEGIASAHSDTLLPLDEIGQADPRDVGGTSYMLANGMGRARAERNGMLRTPVRFRTLFLSTGEVGLADKIAEAGGSVRAGQEVRLVDVPADAGMGLGIIETLNGAASASAFMQSIADGTRRCYGAAAPAFLRYLLGQINSAPDLFTDLRAWMNDLVRQLLAPHPEAGAQVANVARRFALIAVAGELASRAEVTGWDANAATDAAATCFKAWLAERGGVGAREDMQALTQMRAFMTAHASSRFEDWREPDPAAQSEDMARPPHERFRTVKRVGWRRWVQQDDGRYVWVYYLLADGMREALTGLDFRAALKVLVDEGFLIPGAGGKTSQTANPPGHVKVRAYVLLGAILGAGHGEEVPSSDR